VSGIVPPRYHPTLTLRGGCVTNRLLRTFGAKQIVYIQSSQNSDGGFPGRTHTSDPYYTSFALRCAALLGCENRGLWRDSSLYLARQVVPPATIVDCFNLLHSICLTEAHGVEFPLDANARSSIESLLNACLAKQGGFGIAPGAEPSIYQTFLAILCYQMLESFPPGVDQTLEFLKACQCSDGGFTEKGSVIQDGGTNPTSAAIACLLIHEALDSLMIQRATAFIVSMQQNDGGLAAHHSAPVSDLMSTYTGLLTLDKLDAIGTIKLGRVGRFVRAMAAASGGFHGTTSDDVVDLEYTYYGLGTLALLTALAMPHVARSSKSA